MTLSITACRPEDRDGVVALWRATFPGYTDDHAAQLAHFAVGEIASKANAPGLSLARVTGLSTQVVAGVKYYFELEARDAAGATRRFEAQVWEKPGGYANEAPELTGYKEVAAEVRG